ncbi:GAF domain-containing protein, partial [Roseateles sp. GG27B]
MSAYALTERPAQSAALAAVLEPIVSAAMRGQYDLLLCEAEAAVSRLFGGAQAHVLVGAGGNWRKWSELADSSDEPCVPTPAELINWDAPHRRDDVVFVPIVVGALALKVEGCTRDVERSPDLDILRQCLSLALQTCERQRIASQNLDEVQALQRVATRMLKSHDLREILLHITQEARRLLGADICGVLLREGDQIVMQRCVGNHSPQTATLRMGPGQGLAGRVLERREPSSVEDYLTSDIISRDFFHLAEAEMVRSALAAPLLGRESVIGVLEVWRRRPSTFTALDTIRLVALANLASIAIENAELYASQNRMVEELGRANDALSKRYNTVGSLSELTQNLMQTLLQGGGLTAIANSASNFLQSEVVVVDVEGIPLASSATCKEAVVLPALVRELVHGRPSARLAATIRAVVDDAGDRWLAQPLLVEGEIAGWVAGKMGHSSVEMMELTLAQVAMIAAVNRLEQRAASRARSETINAIVWD